MEPVQTTRAHDFELDVIQSKLAQLPQASIPIVHRFAPGLYSREMQAPKGAIVMSKIHKTEHLFAVMKGRLAIWTEDRGVVHLEAPFIGTTKPGTRRIAYIHEDCVWVTFHPTTETDPEKIEEQIIEKRDVNLEIEKAVLAQLQLKEVV